MIVPAHQSDKGSNATPAVAETAPALGRGQIVLAYRLLLGRRPSSSELERELAEGTNLSDLRLRLMRSVEFSRELTRMQGGVAQVPAPRDSDLRAATYPSFALATDAEIRTREFLEWSYQQKSSLSWPLRQVFVSRRAKVIYCPIGKVGCTFLKKQMVRISGVPHEKAIISDVSRMTDHALTGLQLSDYPESLARSMVVDPEMIRIAVVRDPARRLLSAYIEKFVMHRRTAGNAFHTRGVIARVQAQSEPDFDRGISFREFVKVVVSSNPASLDPHWRPQSLYLEGISYDRIYAIEDMDSVVNLLEERSGMELPRKPQNVTNSGTGKFREGAADLAPAEIDSDPSISNESFFEPAIFDAISRYYASDMALHRSAIERMDE